MKQIDPNNIPGANLNKGSQLEKIVLKGVKFGESGMEDITAEVIPFNDRNDEHVDFAFAYSDFLMRMPSEFKSVSECARRYVQLFMKHTVADETNSDSAFYKVYGDLMAARTLFHSNGFQKALNDFFGNA